MICDEWMNHDGWMACDEWMACGKWNTCDEWRTCYEWMICASHPLLRSLELHFISRSNLQKSYLPRTSEIQQPMIKFINCECTPKFVHEYQISQRTSSVPLAYHYRTSISKTSRKQRASPYLSRTTTVPLFSCVAL